MDKWIAFFIALGCFFQAEPGSGQFFQAFVLPVLFIASTVYLLTIPASLILGAAAACFYYTDLSSDSLFRGVILPLFFIFWLLVFLWWAWRTGHLGKAGTIYGGDGSSGGLGSGDGGSCDGGGGGGE